MQLSAPSGASVVIQVSTNLANWISVATNTALNGIVDFSDPNSPGVSRRFYRAILLP
jgi:hypothetical protein